MVSVLPGVGWVEVEGFCYCRYFFTSVSLWQVGDRKGNPSTSNMNTFFFDFHRFCPPQK